MILHIWSEGYGLAKIHISGLFKSLVVIFRGRIGTGSVKDVRCDQGF